MLATACGSLPGEDFPGALRAMTELLPDLVLWPELPARGVGSQMIGRALGLIGGLGFDLQPSGWRLTASPGMDHRRAQATWRRDLDDAEEILQGFSGTIKLAVAGPWSVAATTQRPRGDVLLADHGARREVCAALLEGVDTLWAELVRRLPATTWHLQLDEPALLAVATGTVPTASGFGKHRAIERPELVEALRPWCSRGATVHCCAAGDWLPIVAAAGGRSVAVDAGLFSSHTAKRSLERWLEHCSVHLGVVDAKRPAVQPTDELVNRSLRLLGELDIDHETAQDKITLSTSCGLAGWERRLVTPQLQALTAATALVAERLAS